MEVIIFGGVILIVFLGYVIYEGAKQFRDGARAAQERYDRKHNKR